MCASADKARDKVVRGLQFPIEAWSIQARESLSVCLVRDLGVDRLKRSNFKKETIEQDASYRCETRSTVTACDIQDGNANLADAGSDYE